MIRIVYKREEGYLKNLPTDVVNRVMDIVTLLDDSYGEKRNALADLGGYVLIAETAEDVEDIKYQINLESNPPEYVDLINCENGKNYTNSLILLSSDYSISLLVPLSLTPQELLKYLEE